MYCPFCGTDAGSGRFCPNCGQDMSKAEDVQVSGTDDSGKKEAKLPGNTKKGLAAGIAAVIVALIYTVIPFDIINDAIPVVGWLDDLGIDVGAVLFMIAKAIAQKKSKGN